MKKGGWGRAAVVLLLGAVIGTLLGQIFGALLPEGFWRTLVSAGTSVGLKEPLVLDLAVLKVAFGLTLTVNAVTLAGLLLAVALVVKFSR